MGYKRKEEGGVKTQMRFYSKDKLMKVAVDRGYRTTKSIGDALSKMFGLSSKSVQNKIGNGNFTKEECEVVGSFFDMTMKEYYDVFMNGLFVEDQEGHYICKVDEPYLHLHPGTRQRRNVRQERVDQILEEIKNF